MSRVRWGVLGAAKIAREKVIPAMQRGAHCDVVALASRNHERAREAAEDLGIAKSFGSYEELLADPEIDAVYIPLPNHLHVPWTLKALEAGKHVLCEKPIALDAAEARKLADAAGRHPQLKVMEAFMYRYHPQWQHAKALVASGSLGEIRAIHTTFAYFNIDPANIRNRAEYGGGALMDIGCYCISLSRFLFGREPARVAGDIKDDPDFKTDVLTSGILDFEDATATFICATQMAPHQHVGVFGTEGKIAIDVPFNAPPDRPAKIRHTSKGTMRTIALDSVDQYTVQGDLFSQAVLNDTPVPTPLDDAVANMVVIDAIRRSAEESTWVLC